MYATSQDALPFEFRPLWDAKRPVWAHYFPTFPLSIDNRDPPVDYYNKNYLTTTGESGKHAEYGGFLRSRPLGVTPVPNTTDKAVYTTEDMKVEVAMAISRGITGWFVNIMSADSGINGYFPWMLAAALAVEPRFGVMAMLDMSAMKTLAVEKAVEILVVASKASNIVRLPDGRMVVGSYNANNMAVSWWEDVFTQLNAQSIEVAFVPCLPGGLADAGSLNPISWGVGGWGTATPGPSAGINPDKAHAAGLKAMAPISVQQFRPKGKTYWEASNSVTFRNSWEAAIKTDCELVQIITWSDYSEASQVEPCTDATLNGSIGTAFFDMNAYYASWFATGREPRITQDVLYFFYRRDNSECDHPNQPAAFTCNTSGGPPEEDNIEVVSFLIAPGTVKIAIGGETYEEAVPAGVTSFKVPRDAGVPAFTLERNGSNVFSEMGPAEIYGPEGLPSGILDMTYLNGSVSAKGLTSYDLGWQP